MARYSPLISVMIAAAQKAGRGLARDFGEVENLQTSKKGPGDFVTAADLKAEQILYEELSRVRPGYGFLMEERGAVAGEDADNTWIVDPLDGTTSFMHGYPMFCISIALKRGKDVIAGVIHDPLRDETFWAERGAGCFKDNRRLRVSNRTKMADALFATGLPHMGKGGFNRAMVETRAVLETSSGIRRGGAAALDLAYVAAGRVDGYWEWNLKPWDVAAGLLLVKEAGGIVDTVDNTGDPITGASVLAANDDLLRPLRKTLASAREGQPID